MKPELRVRTAGADDVATMLEWAAAEGWNPGIDDAVAFRTADPSGFFMGLHGDDPAACISVVKYDPGFAFLGLYIVPPEFRGQGDGKAIWDHAIATAGKRTIGLDGVVAQQDNYRKSGFVLAHNNVRFGGRITPPVPHLRSRSIGPDLLDRIVDYDSRFFPVGRGAFLSNWLIGDDSRIALAKIAEGKISGYGVVRRCSHCYKIGPLFADTPALARQLFLELAARADGSEILFDVPEPNREGIALAQEFGLRPVFETARMYRGVGPSLPLERIFGITSFELG